MNNLSDVKLIATDMDHTLLTEKGELPPDFDRYVRELDSLGISFAIASGRPLYTLERIFPELKQKMSLIADNGGIIKHKGEIIFESLMKPADYQEMIRFVEDETDGIAILCGMEESYLSNEYRGYDEYLRTFFRPKYVKNLNRLEVDADKFTIYFPNLTSKKYFDELVCPKYCNKFSVTIGDTSWIDIMNKGIHKGRAMEVLGERLGIRSDQMMAFGDTYNDVEMLQAVKHSYVVKNADDDMKQYANFIADSNENYGVLKVLDDVIRHRAVR